MFYTKDQILALAPDPETAKRAQGFSYPKQWPSLEGNEHLLWGNCKTRQRKFTTWVSISKKKYKCTCKQMMPCRHALGMLLIYLFRSESFRITYDVPEEISDWLNDIQKAPLDAKEQAIRNVKNQQIKIQNKEKRLQEMAVGVLDLEQWLTDVIDEGTAALESQPTDFWESIATRMVDSKLGSIARQIRLMPELIQKENDWHELILEQLGSLYLIVQGFKNAEKLPEHLQKEMFNIAGINYKKQEILLQDGLKDQWIVLGIVKGVEEKLRFRRVWLIGLQTKQWAVLLDFAWGKQDFERNWRFGSIVEGELIYYPSSYPMRALFKSYQIQNYPLQQLPAYPHHEAVMIAYSKAISQNPWLQRFPACVKEVIPIAKDNQVFLLDENQQVIPVAKEDTTKWKLLAISGGHPIRVFGEWDGRSFQPLSAFVEGRLVEM